MARFLGVRVWELSEVPEHYQREALVIMRAQKGARVRKAEESNVGMVTVDANDLLPM